MQKNKTLVEVGHIYLDETLSSYHQKPIDIYKNLYKECDVILMVDDLNIDKKNITADEIKNFYQTKDCLPIEIGYESKMIHYAQKILPLFEENSIKEYFRKEKKYVYFFKKDNVKIALYSIDESNNIQYTCSLLSLCWLLYKHNYFKDFKGYENHVVIIPEQYRNIENNVQKFLSFLDLNIMVENVYF